MRKRGRRSRTDKEEIGRLRSRGRRSRRRSRKGSRRRRRTRGAAAEGT